MNGLIIFIIQFKMLKNVSWIILYIFLTQAAQYQKITDYTVYLKKWKEQVSPDDIHNISSNISINQICYGQPCQYYYYQYKSPDPVSSIQNRTVLLVSGMHGNQYLGPHVLLYGYKHFKAARILYFPMANPSGFIKQKRLTFPTNKDPNRDFPIDSNKQCYQVSSTSILDNIYRQNMIDLTIVLHNGQSNIAFNWGTNFHKNKSHSEDYDIQIEIAQMMQRAGGQNSQLKIQPFIVGTMNQVIYPATGTFDDWAFAAGKYPQFITQCILASYPPYPKNMVNGLLFLIELGPFKNDLFGSQEAVHKQQSIQVSDDGYVSRGIRTIKSALEILSPTLQIRWNQQKAALVFRGCSVGTLNKLQIYQVNNDSELLNIFNLTQPLKVEGNVRKQLPKYTIITYQNSSKLLNDSQIYYKGEFLCSQDWIGKGTTFFAQRRVYQFQSNAVLDLKQDIQELTLLQWYENSALKEVIFYSVLGFAIFCVLSCIFAILRCICSPYQTKREEKFQEQPHQEQQVESGGDLHTARGGIIGDNL